MTGKKEEQDQGYSLYIDRNLSDLVSLVMARPAVVNPGFPADSM